MHRLIAEREPVFISGGAVAAPVGCDSLNPIPHSASLVQNQGVSFSTLPVSRRCQDGKTFGGKSVCIPVGGDRMVCSAGVAE